LQLSTELRRTGSRDFHKVTLWPFCGYSMLEGFNQCSI